MAVERLMLVKEQITGKVSYLKKWRIDISMFIIQLK